jgi:hypothetical protein
MQTWVKHIPVINRDYGLRYEMTWDRHRVVVFKVRSSLTYHFAILDCFKQTQIYNSAEDAFYRAVASKNPHTTMKHAEMKLARVRK